MARRKAGTIDPADVVPTFTADDEAEIRVTKELLAGAAADPDMELARWIEISRKLNRSTAWADQMTNGTRGRRFVRLRGEWLKAAGFLDHPILKHKGTRSVLMKFAHEPFTSMLRSFHAGLDVHAKLHLRHPVAIFNKAVEAVAGPRRAAKAAEREREQAAEREREQKAAEEAAKAREQHDDDVAHVIAAIQLLTKNDSEITVETVAATLADPGRYSPVLIGGILADLQASGEYDKIVAKAEPDEPAQFDIDHFIDALYEARDRGKTEIHWTERSPEERKVWSQWRKVAVLAATPGNAAEQESAARKMQAMLDFIGRTLDDIPSGIARWLLSVLVPDEPKTQAQLRAQERRQEAATDRFLECIAGLNHLVEWGSPMIGGGLVYRKGTVHLSDVVMWLRQEAHQSERDRVIRNINEAQTTLQELKSALEAPETPGNAEGAKGGEPDDEPEPDGPSGGGASDATDADHDSNSDGDDEGGISDEAMAAMQADDAEDRAEQPERRRRRKRRKGV